MNYTFSYNCEHGYCGHLKYCESRFHSKPRQRKSIDAKLNKLDKEYTTAKNQVLRQCQLIKNLYAVVETNKLEVYYQPLIDLTNNKIIGVESSLIKDFEATKQVIIALKKMGISIAIDDFGTGYSSLSYLQEFPLDLVKIDRSFVTNLDDCFKKRALVKAIIDLSKNLNLQVVGEGIETAKEMDFLLDNNCDYGQGYLISKPLSIEDFYSFILNYNYQSSPEKLALKVV